MAGTISRYGRREFIERLGALAVAGPVVLFQACVPDDPHRAGEVSRGSALAQRGLLGDRLLTWSRPQVSEIPGGSVLVRSSESPPIAAYVSRRSMDVFVDKDFRDHVYWVLRAHISVSTGLWRIPLPEDPPGLPIAPDDQDREFTERPLSAWPADPLPTEGDMRVVIGVPGTVRVPLPCLRVTKSEETGWIAGEPLEFPAHRPGGERAWKQVLRQVGTARRFGASGCRGPGVPVRCLAWSRR